MIRKLLPGPQQSEYINHKIIVTISIIRIFVFYFTQPNSMLHSLLFVFIALLKIFFLQVFKKNIYKYKLDVCNVFYPQISQSKFEQGSFVLNVKMKLHELKDCILFVVVIVNTKSNYFNVSTQNQLCTNSSLQISLYTNYNLKISVFGQISFVQLVKYKFLLQSFV
eukprot:EC096038.1.p2 GENE.EC096038.1~~EC096038.1.p2  ORF type:complete len:166 (+),score=6.31 EC096038.1:80-577(+)